MTEGRCTMCLLLVSAAVASAASPPAAAAVSRASPSLKFLVIGDWGGQGSGEPATPKQIDNARGMAAFGEKMGGLDFVMSVGDNFYQQGVRDVSDKRFKTSFEDVYDQKELQCPWYQLAGNHDHRGNVTAQLAYHHTSNRWMFPSLWYTYSKSFTAASGKTVTSQFVHIDTSVLYGIEEADDVTGETISWEPSPLQVYRTSQLAWLEGAPVPPCPSSAEARHTKGLPALCRDSCNEHS